MTTLTAPTPVPNAAAKSQLARLMATENITVEFEAKAQTASFNMESRVLILPVWKDLADDALDMLIGHEVSHALHTPAGAKPLMDACNAIDPKNPMVAKDYLNVVEDARIERMIKARFPGLKRSFAEGYRDLLKRDLFGLKKIGNVADLPLIDRINLQYKIGWLIEVPFSSAELPLAQRVATTITWDDVVALSKEIYEYAKQNQKQDPNKDGDSDQSDGEEGEEGAGAGGEKRESKEESESDSVPSEQDDGDDQDDGDEEKGSNSESDSDADEESDSTGEGEEGTNDDADEDGTEGGEDSRPSDKDADASDDDDSESDSDDGAANGKNHDESESSDSPAPSSKTLKSMEQGLQGLVDTAAPTIYYADLPSIDKGFVIPLKKTQESLREWVKAFSVNPAALTAAYASWKTNNAGAVQVLATEFDRRKAADAHKRTAIAETGSIDPNRLHAYRIAEDIFLQNAYVKEGKNHGIVLLLDMSGSMGGIFHDTMIQLVTLAHFCRRVNVPFVFYGYSDRNDKGMPREPSFKKTSFGAESTPTRLFTLLSDGMRMNEFVEQSSLLLLASVSAGGTPREDHPTWKALSALQYRRPWNPPEWMMLDNTPTNGALLGMAEVIEEFKRVKRVQIANLIVLTDGEPSDDLCNLNSSAYYAKNPADPNDPNKWTRWSKVRTLWRDAKRRKEYAATRKYPNYMGGTDEYALGREQQSGRLMDIIRDRTGAKTICIHLMTKRMGGKHGAELAVKAAKDAIERNDPKTRRDAEMAIRAKVEKAWADNEWIGIPMGNGFNEYIIVRTDVKEEEWDLDEVDMTSKSGLRDLRKTFTKSMAATRSNRPLLTRVADLISKN